MFVYFSRSRFSSFHEKTLVKIPGYHLLKNQFLIDKVHLVQTSIHHSNYFYREQFSQKFFYITPLVPASKLMKAYITYKKTTVLTFL